MQGTGTQEEPYQITNTEELKNFLETNSGSGTIEVFGKLMNDIDLSALTGTINVPAHSKTLFLNGQNFKIRNFNKQFPFIYLMSEKISNFDWGCYGVIKFENIVFENFILNSNVTLFEKGNSDNSYTNCGFFFTNCVISINMLSNNRITDITKKNQYFKKFIKCTVSIKSTSQTHDANLFTGCDFDTVHIHIKGNIRGVSDQSTFNASYITGNTTNDSAVLISQCTNFSNSYVAVAANGATAKIFDSTAPTVNAASFVDKDIVTATGLSENSPIKQLTTAQAKNAEYLTSIGFLTIPESE